MNPMMIEFPTERLLIRMPKPGNGRTVFNAIQRSIHELKPWMRFAHNEYSEQQTEINIRNAYVKFINCEDLRLHIFLKDTGEFIASSGLHRINWDVPKFEIGYWINTR